MLSTLTRDALYPGDKFAVSAVLQGSGEEPLEIDVQLLDGLDSGSGNQKAENGENRITPPGDVIDSQKVIVKSDGTLTGIRFELEPEAVGRRRLAIRLVAPKADNNEQDNIRDARYEVVGEKLKVLAVAGGPTREYRFVRNMLYRDNSIQLDAWLQTGQPGIQPGRGQHPDAISNHCRRTLQYDAIVMFDPIDGSGKRTVAVTDRHYLQAGVIIVAGPVYHPEWKRRRTDPREHHCWILPTFILKSSDAV